MKVSFIVPVYKVERFLPQCVNSLLKQTYQNIEIVLVDDGSPDDCPEICDNYASEDSRVKVVHKLNGGLSDARNCGLKESTGDYVVFVDGDDFWRNFDDLSRIVAELNKSHNIDFMGFNCTYYYENTNSYSNWVPFTERNITSSNREEIIVELVKSGTFPMSACLKILKRTFLLKNGLFFEKGLIGEDIPWFISLLDKAQSLRFVNNYIYAYRQNVAGSITNTFSKKAFDDVFSIVKSEISRISERTFSFQEKNAILSFLAYEYCILLGMFQILDKTDKKKYWKELSNYKYLLQYTMNPKVKMVYRVYKIFGLKFTSIIMSIYLQRK